ncbi:glycosyltransferase family A protein [Gluconacetobacter tumulisoli]|uniref:Glycosyltransferase n=1 Tax=Gluconacetobacter tumulisoli TaxID=1286189 RepID=A0A7W4K605_9PROT|nr:glycosyltransferase family 2 protein [Gluconacetobacter tumulisoli]MBB2201001.1 glycosyltransferase [Gluconacetobacter tumulisoli]
MQATVVIRSMNEADRLRLTLTSLACQTEAAEVVVVNDGSTDHTATVIAEAPLNLDLVAVHHAKPAGRSAAANAGAAQASGDILIFLDGDTLAGPDLVARHLQCHRLRPNLIVRGENFHLRCTRPFRDPEAGTPQPGHEDRVARMSPAELDRARVTRTQIWTRFDEIDARAQPGVYPGYGPRKLYELEMEALRTEEDCDVLWAAAAGANQSVVREAFLESGGFHPDLTINEHRELALRLCRAGGKMAASTARSYHMIHRSGWRDPLEDKNWEDIFYTAHPRADVALLPLLWQSLSDEKTILETSRILSLPQLASIAAEYEGLEGRDAVRAAYLATCAAPSHARHADQGVFR